MGYFLSYYFQLLFVYVSLQFLQFNHALYTKKRRRIYALLTFSQVRSFSKGGAPPPPPYPLATGVLLVPEFIYMLPWRRASVAPNCAITAMSTGEFWEANSRKEVWTGHSKLSCRKRSYKMASNAGDDSLYPIAVLIDELRNEDVQV